MREKVTHPRASLLLIRAPLLPRVAIPSPPSVYLPPLLIPRSTKFSCFFCVFVCIVAGFLFYHDPNFFASIKNSAHAWQQSIVKLVAQIHLKTKATFLAALNVLNFAKINAVVTSLFDNLKVVLQDYLKYCVDVYQSVAGFARDVWNENFNAAAVKK